MRILSQIGNFVGETIRFIRFVSFIQKYKIFKATSPDIVLLLMSKFFILQHKQFSERISITRTFEESSGLFEALVNSYMSSKSGITLNQVFTVLEEDFIGERINGRKQFQIR